MKLAHHTTCVTGRRAPIHQFPSSGARQAAAIAPADSAQQDREVQAPAQRQPSRRATPILRAPSGPTRWCVEIAVSAMPGPSILLQSLFELTLVIFSQSLCVFCSARLQTRGFCANSKKTLASKE